MVVACGSSDLRGHHPVAAGTLGAVQGGVGFGDKLVDRLVGSGGDGDTDRHAHPLDAVVPQIQRAHRVPDALAYVDGDRAGRVAQQDDELLATVAGGHVVVANRRDDGAAHGPQDLVPDGVSVPVI